MERMDRHVPSAPLKRLSGLAMTRGWGLTVVAKVKVQRTVIARRVATKQSMVSIMTPYATVS